MNGPRSDGGHAPRTTTRRRILQLGAGATGAVLGFGGLTGTAAAWERFDVDFRSTTEVWLIVGDDLEYDPPAVANVVVTDGESVTCDVVEFRPSNTVAGDAYGDANVVRYEAPSGETVLGVLPYNRGGGSRFSRPRCLMANDRVESATVSELAPRADCVRTAMNGPWNGTLQNCWWDPIRSGAQEMSGGTRLRPDDGEPDGNVGRSLAVNADGTVLLVGAPDRETAGGSDGAAYVFSRQEGAWRQTARLDPPAGSGTTSFGDGVTLDAAGRTALVNHSPDDFDARDRVLVFEADGQDWTRTATIEAPPSSGPATDLSGFGFALALDDAGETAVVGAEWTGLSAGEVAVFRRDGTEWVAESTFTHAQGDDNYFGSAVDVAETGDSAVVGAPVPREGPGEGGYASVATRADGDWQPTHRLRAADRRPLDALGSSVACDARCETVVAGDPRRAVGDDPDQGRVSVFVSENDEWVESIQVLAPDGAAGDEFGHAVAVDPRADTVLVGAPGRDTAGNSSAGAAYVCAPNGGGGWSVRTTVVASDGDAGDRFGEAVALDATGETLVVGAPEAGETGAGAVYVFDRSAARDADRSGPESES